MGGNMRAIWALVREMMLELLRKKDFYVLLILMMVLLGFFSAQNFFDIEGISRYMRDFGYTLVMLLSFIVAVTFSAKQIPSEIESGTVYPLLAKPVSRFLMVFGKFCGSVMVSVITFTLYFGVFVLFCFSEVGRAELVLLAQSYLFGIMFLSVVSALTVFFSVFLTTSANISITLLTYFFMISFSDILRDIILTGKGAIVSMLGVLYYLLPHFEFFDLRVRLTHAWDPLPLWVVCAVVAYAIVYCSGLLFFAGRLFGRKKL
jgi:ABC-type transport system involved in multi-copper enzyme maturation permease subunit